MQLELKNIIHRYGNFTALNNINITFEPGLYALLGPNGAGKSTMMNIITGVLEPTQGETLFNGIPTKTLGKNFREQLSYMPQQQGLYESFTVNRFFAYIGSLKGISNKDIESEINEVLELVNLSNVKHKYIHELSGGMKQRILIAQALMDNPQVIILDEPTAGLDPKERIRIRNIISQTAMNRIVLFATHVVSDIEHLAKRVLFLKKGEIINTTQSPIALCKELEGKVFELIVTEDEFEAIRENYVISNIVETENGIQLRVISETVPLTDNCRTVFPTLEDVYLYLFEIDL